MRRALGAPGGFGGSGGSGGFGGSSGSERSSVCSRRVRRGGLSKLISMFETFCGFMGSLVPWFLGSWVPEACGETAVHVKETEGPVCASLQTTRLDK